MLFLMSASLQRRVHYRGGARPAHAQGLRGRPRAAPGPLPRSQRPLPLLGLLLRHIARGVLKDNEAAAPLSHRPPSRPPPRPPPAPGLTPCLACSSARRCLRSVSSSSSAMLASGGAGAAATAPARRHHQSTAERPPRLSRRAPAPRWGGAACWSPSDRLRA